MWEDFIKCFKKGRKIKGCAKVQIQELFKRVPPGQRENLNQFAHKHSEYIERVRKYPDKLPTIDWNYYKKNVREEMVDWVKDFEKKYDKLDSMYTNRHSLIDFSKYFGELEKQTAEVEEEVKKYKLESEKRIQHLQNKIHELNSMKPYTEMTMEEFCFAHPNEAPDFINKPTFWPHTVEENLPNVEHVHEEKKVSHKPDPKKTPPKDSPSGSENPEKGKDVDSKKPKEPEKAKVKVVEAQPKEESQMAEKVTDLASKGFEFVKEMGSKALVVLQGLWEKWESKRKQVAKTAEAERSKNEAEDAVKIVNGEPVRKLASPEICNKTIIRGEEMAEADVKEHHTDLNIESDAQPEEEICRRRKKEEAKSKSSVCEEECEAISCKKEKAELKCEKDKKVEDKSTICYQKYEEKASRLSAEEEKCCEEAVKQDCAEILAKPSEDECQKESTKDENKCKSDEKASLDKIQEPMAFAEQPTKAQGSSTAKDNTIIGMHQECLTAENEIFLGSNVKSETAEKSKSEASNKKMPEVAAASKRFGKVRFEASDNEVKQVSVESKAELSDKPRTEQVKDVAQQMKGDALNKMVAKTSSPSVVKAEKDPTDSLNDVIGAALDKMVTKTPAPMIVKSERDRQDTDEIKSVGDAKVQDVQGYPEEIARNMFKMATGAAQLLSDAKKSIEKVRRENAGQIEVLQHAYETAEKQVNLALSQAYSALASAKKLAHRAQATLEADEQKLVATIEKHSMLAKLLANQAVTMQKEIAKLLAGLKRKQ
ncbi:hypothetical protein KR044_003527 [Drosophila immigrans]|nr:hypothetical protein KR044_003527 [Drosophila immigrans]